MKVSLNRVASCSLSPHFEGYLPATTTSDYQEITVKIPGKVLGKECTYLKNRILDCVPFIAIRF